MGTVLLNASAVSGLWEPSLLLYFDFRIKADSVVAALARRCQISPLLSRKCCNFIFVVTSLNLCSSSLFSCALLLRTLVTECQTRAMLESKKTHKPVPVFSLLLFKCHSHTLGNASSDVYNSHTVVGSSCFYYAQGRFTESALMFLL